MKKFHFRLETLLKYRKIQEEKAQIALAEADRLLQQEKRTLEKIEAKLDDAINILRQKQEKTTTADELNLYSVYIMTTKNNANIQKNKVLAAKKTHFEYLKKAEETMRQRKVVEKIKEKQMGNYYLEFLKEEQKYLDEIGTQISIRDKVSVM